MRFHANPYRDIFKTTNFLQITTMRVETRERHRKAQKEREGERERQQTYKNWGTHKTLNEFGSHLVDLCITTEKKQKLQLHFVHSIRNIIFVAMAMFAIWFLFHFFTCVRVDFIYSTNLFYYNVELQFLEIVIFLFCCSMLFLKNPTKIYIRMRAHIWDELKSAKCLCNTQHTLEHTGHGAARCDSKIMRPRCREHTQNGWEEAVKRKHKNPITNLKSDTWMQYANLNRTIGELCVKCMVNGFSKISHAKQS